MINIFLIAKFFIKVTSPSMENKLAIPICTCEYFCLSPKLDENWRTTKHRTVVLLHHMTAAVFVS